MHDLDELVGRFTRNQGGLVTRKQLLGAGCRPAQLDGLLTRGRLDRIAPRVYAVSGAPVPPEQPSWAAVLATGGLLTGEHLLAILEIEGATFEGPPQVVIGASKCRGPTTPWVALRCKLAEGQRRRYGCLNGVSVELAVLHLAVGVDVQRLRVLIDAARWANRLKVARLLALALGMGAHLGAQKVRWTAEAGMLADESDGERDMDDALGSLGLLFRHQAGDALPGRRFDRYCDSALLALEFDGRVGQRDLDRDAEKDLEAAHAGILVLHVTSTMLRPHNVAATRERIASLVLQRTRPHAVVATGP